MSTGDKLTLAAVGTLAAFTVAAIALDVIRVRSLVKLRRELLLRRMDERLREQRALRRLK